MKSTNGIAERNVLTDWKDELAASESGRRVIAHFEAHVSTLAGAMLDEARAEVPQLRGAPATILERVLRHCEHHVHAMVRIMKLGFDLERADFGFVRDNAATRAREGYPLEALLRAYRAGHKATWSTMCRIFVGWDGPLSPEAARGLVALSAFAMDYTNHISNVAASTYSDEARHRDRLISRTRAELLEALLTNAEDPSLVQRARHYGLEPGSEFLVFAVRARRPDGADVDELLTDCTRALERLLAPHCPHLLIDIRRGEIVGVSSARSDFDRELAHLLLDTRHKWSGEATVRVGMSPVRPGLENLPLSYQDSQHALSHADARRPVVCFCDLSVFDHLVATADASTYRIRPPWLESLVAEDARMHGALLATLRAYVEARLSAKTAATALGVHVNTVYHRLKKFESISCHGPQDLSALLNAITLLRLHRLSGEGASPGPRQG